MTESERVHERFRPFEGLWLMTNPSGGIACGKIVGKTLLIPYSFGNESKLSGHYYDFHVLDQTLFGRFEQFDSASGGVFFLSVGPNDTLQGGRWMNDQVPQEVRSDVSKLLESLPGMHASVWVRLLRNETPAWAERYFREDWPNKPF